MSLVSLLLIPLLVYALLAALMFVAQTWLIFPASRVGPAGPLMPRAERLELAAPSGHVLHGVLIPAAGRREDGQLLVLGFAGNASNAQATAEYLHELFPEADAAAFHYRGYAPSTGVPGASGLQQDALLIHDYLRQHRRPDRTVAVGFSIGSGVAAFLAAHRPLDGLILVTPFDSLAGVAASHYPWLPVRLLMRHELEPARDLAESRVPVALIAGRRDATIPPARTEALRRAVPNLVFARDFDESGHNDIYEHPGFRSAMREGLAAILARPVGGS